MKILIIASSFPPYNAIASLRPYSWAKYWSRWGHDVTVLTTKKNHDISSNLNLDCSAFEVIEVDYMSSYPFIAKHVGNPEVKVKETKTSPHGTTNKKRSFIRSLARNLFSGTGAISNDCRMPNTYQLWVKAACAKIKEIGGHYDVAISTYAPFATLQIGYRLKKAGIVDTLAFDYRDLWIESPFKGVHGFRWIEKVLEKKWAKTADVITTVSQPLADTLSTKFKKSVDVVLNGVDLDDLHNVEKNSILNPDKINIMYAGSLYTNLRDPEPLFAALSDLNKEGIDTTSVQILFATGNTIRIDELTSLYQLGENVRNLGFLPRPQILYMQQKADIVLFLAHNGEGGEGFLGGKLSELLYSGSYIWVIGRRGQPSDIIEDYGCGKHLGNDIQIIKEELRGLLAGIRPEVPSNIEKKAEVFTREYQSQNLLSVIRRIKKC